VDDKRAAELLRDGDVEIVGRMPWSSNATFLVRLFEGDDEMLAIYKPQRGERPLWDFPRGTLCHRELAAFEVSEALAWSIVPDTVLRDAPHGLGMMQRFVEHDPEQHYFTLLEEHEDAFRRMAAFDVVINNTDRKGGHCLRANDGGRIFGIDHGVSFHTQWKLRTVIWEFGGESIPPDVCGDLHRLLDEVRRGSLRDRLAPLLDRFELDALQARIEHLLTTGMLPEADGDYYAYPWPTI
jgi:phosphoinositide 3-/4-kinase-like protein